MHKNNPVIFVFLILFVTLIFIPGFFENRWKVVETEEYIQWQGGWESLIVARLVKSRQDGMFSAGGLSGIGDVTEWDLGKKTVNHQYEVYKDEGKFETYLVYKSFPGFQGFLFSSFDAMTDLPSGLNIKLFRGVVAVISSMVLAFFSIGLFMEFGWIASVLVIIFIVMSKWFTLPAGNIYWNLWSFYLSPLIIMYYLALVTNKGEYPARKIHWIVFITTLVKILFSGFEFITTQLLMSTVPFVYFSVRDDWGLKVFSKRMLKLGIVLLLAVLVGLMILTIQIFGVEGSLSSASEHIVTTINRRAIGNPETLSRVYAESMRVSGFSVIWEYLNIPAVSINFHEWKGQITYLYLIILFFIFTGIFVINLITMPVTTFRQKGKALMVASWYSTFAPLSWLIVFKPHSYLHPFLNPIVWQMPFTLLGIAFCGFILFDLLKKEMP